MTQTHTHTTPYTDTHTHTTPHTHTPQITQSPECVCANGDQTVDHLIFDCPKL